MRISSPSLGVGARLRTAGSPPALDDQRVWLLQAILFSVRHWGHGRGEPLSPVMFSVLLTLLWRGTRTPGDITVPCSYESMARSVGHTRPGRATQHDTPRPSGGLRQAAEAMLERGLLQRGELRRRMGADGRWETAPYRWAVAVPSDLVGVVAPAWPDAVAGISRVASQHSVYGPVADMVWVRLALIASASGSVRVTRDTVREMTGVAPDAALRHLERMSAGGGGVSLRRSKRGRQHTWIVQLTLPPDLGSSRAECDAFLASVGPARAAALGRWHERMNDLGWDRVMEMRAAAAIGDLTRAAAVAEKLDEHKPPWVTHSYVLWVQRLTREDINDLRVELEEEATRPAFAPGPVPF